MTLLDWIITDDHWWRNDDAHIWKGHECCYIMGRSVKSPEDVFSSRRITVYDAP